MQPTETDLRRHRKRQDLMDAWKLYAEQSPIHHFVSFTFAIYSESERELSEIESRVHTTPEGVIVHRYGAIGCPTGGLTADSRVCSKHRSKSLPAELTGRALPPVDAGEAKSLSFEVALRRFYSFWKEYSLLTNQHILTKTGVGMQEHRETGEIAHIHSLITYEKHIPSQESIKNRWGYGNADIRIYDRTKGGAIYTLLKHSDEPFYVVCPRIEKRCKRRACFYNRNTSNLEQLNLVWNAPRYS